MKNKVGNFKAQMFEDFRRLIETLVNKDQGFYFLNKTRGTTACWKKFQSQAIAMIKQSGCPLQGII